MSAERRRCRTSEHMRKLGKLQSLPEPVRARFARWSCALMHMYDLPSWQAWNLRLQSKKCYCPETTALVLALVFCGCSIAPFSLHCRRLGRICLAGRRLNFFVLGPDRERAGGCEAGRAKLRRPGPNFSCVVASSSLFSAQA